MLNFKCTVHVHKIADAKKILKHALHLNIELNVIQSLLFVGWKMAMVMFSELKFKSFILFF